MESNKIWMGFGAVSVPSGESDSDEADDGGKPSKSHTYSSNANCMNTVTVGFTLGNDVAEAAYLRVRNELDFAEREVRRLRRLAIGLVWTNLVLAVLCLGLLIFSRG